MLPNIVERAQYFMAAPAFFLQHFMLHFLALTAWKHNVLEDTPPAAFLFSLVWPSILYGMG